MGLHSPKDRCCKYRGLEEGAKDSNFLKILGNKSILCLSHMHILLLHMMISYILNPTVNFCKDYEGIKFTRINRNLLTDYFVRLKKLQSRSQNGCALDRFCVF